MNVLSVYQQISWRDYMYVLRVQATGACSIQSEKPCIEYVVRGRHSLGKLQKLGRNDNLLSVIIYMYM